MICGKILSISLTWAESSKWLLWVAEWALRQAQGRFTTLRDFAAAWIPGKAGDFEGNKLPLCQLPFQMSVQGSLLGGSNLPMAEFLGHSSFEKIPPVERVGAHIPLGFWGVTVMNSCWPGCALKCDIVTGAVWWGATPISTWREHNGPFALPPTRKGMDSPMQGALVKLWFQAGLCYRAPRRGF